MFVDQRRPKLKELARPSQKGRDKDVPVQQDRDQKVRRKGLLPLPKEQMKRWTRTMMMSTWRETIRTIRR